MDATLQPRRAGRAPRRVAVTAVLLALFAQMLPSAVAVALTPQAIAFALPASGQVGATIALTASSDSGLAVALVEASPETCVLVGSSLTLVAIGTCTVTASQPGDESFAPADDVVATMAVEAATPTPSPQAISFSLPGSGVVGATVELTASTGSGLVVTLVVGTPGTCSVVGTTLALLAVGICTVTASQAGDATWAAAADVAVSMAVVAAPPVLIPQTISFSLPGSGVIGGTIELVATSDSGLPVDVAGSTPATCALNGTTLSLVAVGTCTVLASQPGDATWAAAADVAVSMAVEAAPEGVDLGKYAVNGAVRAIVADATTGRTYLGGDFTEIGLRTGPVAVVDPPESGTGTLRAASPEVLGTVAAVFADDRTDDPGFFIVGELIAVNGVAVANLPVIRMRLDRAIDRWVVDADWTYSTSGYGCAGFSRARAWLATPDWLVAAGVIVPGQTTTGISLVDRRTGACSTTMLARVPPLPNLVACTACGGQAEHLAWDATTDRLIVAYITHVGATADTIVWEAWLAAYDLTAPGSRLWHIALQGDPPDGASNTWRGVPVTIGIVGGEALVQGTFHLDSDDVDYDHASHNLAVDLSSGAILQRWNTLGEEDPIDGSSRGPASLCLTRQGAIEPFFDVAGTVSHFTGYADGYMVCQYAATAGSIDATRLGDYVVTKAPLEELPVVPYRAPGGPLYLLSADHALNVASGDVSDWDPAPGTPSTSSATWVAVSTGGVVLAGSFPFVRGRSSPGVVALDADHVPDADFMPPPLAWPNPDIRTLAMDQGWLIVGGSYREPTISDIHSLVALDPETGRQMAWSPPDPPETVSAIAVDPATGAFWVGGRSVGSDPSQAVALQHFAPPAAGGAPLPAPDLACLEAPLALNVPSDSPICAPDGDGATEVTALAFDDDGHLYVAGAFGAVDGHPARGLVRLQAGGDPDGWAADLLGALAIPAGSGLRELLPKAIAVSGGRLLVGGRFMYATKGPDGISRVTAISPLLAFSIEHGALLKPTGAGAYPWFPVAGSWTAGYAIVARDDLIAVALGDVGVVVLDPATLGFEPGESAPLLHTDWWARDWDHGVFALVTPTIPVADRSRAPRLRAPALNVASTTTATDVVLGGVIPRWGDHVAGNVVWTTVVADETPPTVTAPAASLRVGAALSGSAVPLVLTWSGSDAGGSGIVRYELGRTVNGGATWSTVSTSLSTPRAYATAASSGTVRYRVRAIDGAGHVGAWATGPTLSARLLQQNSTSVKVHGSWTSTSYPSFSGGTAKYAKVAGAYATYAFTGRSIALVTTTARTRGKVRVYVNGAYVATVDLYASSTHYRVLAWQKTWSTSATRTVKLVLVGGGNRPRVDVDAFATLR